MRVEGTDYTYAVAIKVAGGHWELLVSEAGIYDSIQLNDGPVAGQYYYIKLVRDISTGVQQLWINGVLKATLNQVQTGNTLMVATGIVYYEGTELVDLCFDDLIVARALDCSLLDHARRLVGLKDFV